ncbi:MAG: hypothetical protein EP338_03070 [Bacteroidetes bacterium]|nr:MAG: hypothetical protein EP338_03070 [Bacteroidota bacterium]
MIILVVISFQALVYRISSIKFNYYLGAFSFIGLNVSVNLDLNELLSILLGLLGFLLYVLEGWAFVFKLNRISARYFFDRTGGKINVQVEHNDPGCMIWYAFLVRMLLRIGLILLSLAAIGNNPNDLPLWGGILMGAAVLFELFFMLYSMFESKIFSSEKEGEEPSESELKWRKKHFPRIHAADAKKKEKYANIILLITAWVINISLWNVINGDFIRFINDSKATGESVLLIASLMLSFSFILCLFLLIPVRLAHWVEETVNAKDPVSKRKLRWSIIFAGVATTSPTWIELIRVYVFGT